MNIFQKALLVIFLGASFSCASIYAYHDMFDDKQSASTLRECGINPVNGAWDVL